MAPPRANSNSAVPPRGGGILGSLSTFWQRTYAADYVGFVLLLVGYFIVQFTVEPFHRMFSVSDLRIAFPHAEKERVPLAHNFLYALFLPLLTLVSTNLFTRAPRHKHHVALLGLAISLILTSLLTDIIKNTAGRPRPDLLARCVPEPGTPRDVLVTISVCTRDAKTEHHTLHDGWRSFPSGHSSFSFAGLGYTSLFLAGQLRVFAHSLSPLSGGHPDQLVEKVVRGDLVRALLCGAPLLGAAMIAMSRCQDYRHDVWDVSVGGLLGWTVAYWSYRRYWPRLGSGRCDEPYAGPPGAEAGGEGYYGRVRDLEEGEGSNVD
ncbi:acid phosphatase/Vanadium-dependent haloperoxidase [Parathielavia hyrcaniae]|uniref:Acid phosphatase/Vanadium-dependent haloperoxidase n=1 Tax=Parathielavia hyrcaniae TaxID=113614 RepID=A0AAN6PUI5_9PEZI|nr:acid phosphatase/Vanadium-dependent haloperoxidase [Parathielavia hyrcaniae]